MRTIVRKIKRSLMPLARARGWTRLMDRSELILRDCDRQGKGLEIGASHAPVASRACGYDVEIVDHASAGELRAKYSALGEDVGGIEEVDYIWQGEPLSELVGKRGQFDWIIASHVVEHTPDLLTFLRECSTLLKPNGLLSLAIPDHRYCFDFFRPVSTPGEVLDAYYEKRTRHRAGTLWDHMTLTASAVPKRRFFRQPGSGSALFASRIEHPRDQFETFLRASEYCDAHNWRFTPSSFRLILSDSSSMGITDLDEQRLHVLKRSEFIVQLRKSSFRVRPIDGVARARQLEQIHRESLDR